MFFSPEHFKGEKGGQFSKIEEGEVDKNGGNIFKKNWKRTQTNKINNLKQVIFSCWLDIGMYWSMFIPIINKKIFSVSYTILYHKSLVRKLLKRILVHLKKNYISAKGTSSVTKGAYNHECRLPHYAEFISYYINYIITFNLFHLDMFILAVLELCSSVCIVHKGLATPSFHMESPFLSTTPFQISMLPPEIHQPKQHRTYLKSICFW